MKLRNIPILVRYYELYDVAPKNFAFGFAAYILFMKAVKKESEKYYGERNSVSIILSMMRRQNIFMKYGKIILLMMS